MVDVKQAVSTAVEYIKKLYDSKTLEDLMLEEVELSNDEKYWLITLGFNQFSMLSKLENLVNPLTVITGSPQGSYNRVYKIIKVKTDDGQAIAMKIRIL